MLLETLKQFKPYSISPGYNANQIIFGTYSHNDIIEGTTYIADKDYQKAMEGIVHCHIDRDKIYVLSNQNSLLFAYEKRRIVFVKGLNGYLSFLRPHQQVIRPVLNRQYVFLSQNSSKTEDQHI